MMSIGSLLRAIRDRTNKCVSLFFSIRHTEVPSMNLHIGHTDFGDMGEITGLFSF